MFVDFLDLAKLGPRSVSTFQKNFRNHILARRLTWSRFVYLDT